MSRSTFNWGLRLFAGAILIGCIAVGLAYSWLAPGKDDYQGEIVAASLNDEVSILRDQFAVPHVFATSELDAYYALGFAQAQDRYWQMVLSSYYATGRLSEIFGRAALDQDISNRTYDIAAQAREGLEALEAADLSRLRAYVAGVNGWLDSDKAKTPPEFLVFGFPMPRWTEFDSMVIEESSTLVFGVPIDQEMRLMEARERIGTERANQLFSTSYNEGHVSMAIADVRKTMESAFEQLEKNGPEANLGFGGNHGTEQHHIEANPVRHHSNNWVVSGEHTRSGKPMLAGDPHLPLVLPSTWYLAHVSYPGHEIVGALRPGSPGVVIGRNENLAFSLTYSMADNYDLFVLRRGDTPSSYVSASGEKSFQVRSESFLIKGEEAPFQYDYLHSDVGVVLPAQVIAGRTELAEDQLLAMSWAMEYRAPSGLKTLTSNRAETVDEWMSAMEQSRGLDRNVVVAHKDGDIGLIRAGTQAWRNPDQRGGGMVPAPGEDPASSWRGVYPQSLLPRVVNPVSGKLVTANAQVVPDEFPVPLRYYYSPPSRQQRIQALLDAEREHDWMSFKSIQLDSTNVGLERIRAALLSTEPRGSSAERAIKLLESWDGDYRADSAAPIVYLTWFYHLGELIAADELGGSPHDSVMFSVVFLERVLLHGEQHWCHGAPSVAPTADPCAAVLSESLATTMRQIEDEYGENWIDARFESNFEMRLPHSGLGVIPLVGDLVNREVKPSDGLGVPTGPDAPNVGYSDKNQLPALRTDNALGASMRFIIDWEEPDRAKFILAGGQSGNFGSQHYDDQLQLWLQGKYIEIPTDRDALDVAYEMRLIPGEQDPDVHEAGL